MSAIIRLLFLAVFLAVSAGTPASADVADKIFDLLKSKGSYVGIDPDGVEMARYLAYFPESGAAVLSHAAEQDYPFFGLVGAVKAAKGKNFPKLGTFTEPVCLTPITAIDDVFAKADGMISNAGGKEDTKDVISGAKNYAKAYALAQTDAAKGEVVKELADKIPYFKDIPLICHFGFHTEFKAEKDIQNLVSEKVKKAKDVYLTFHDGDIVKGASLLVELGFSADMVCDIVDGALTSSGVGAIPGVSQLSNGLCKNYVGKFIGKAIDKGAALVKDAACAVYDWFGGSCNEDVKAPPTGIGNAKAFCVPYGGLEAAMSKTNAPDDYSLTCNNGMACRAQPGKPLVCTTFAQAAARLKDKQAHADDEFNNGLQDFSVDFRAKNIDTCPDDICKGDMESLLLKYQMSLQGLHKQQPGYTFFGLEGMIQNTITKEVANAKAAAAQRAQALNGNKNAKATAEWQKFFVDKWSKECPGKSCIEAVQMIGVAYATEAKKLQANNPEMSFSDVQKQMTKKYAKMFQDYVAQAKKEALASNIDAPASDQMHALDCKNFLGRADQYLCSSEYAFKQCVGRVKQGEAKLCMFGAKSYGAPATVAALLGNQGCTKSKQGFVCKSAKSEAICERFIAGGMTIACGQAPAETAAAQTPSGTGVGQSLQQPCKPYLGRADQFLCRDEAGYTACVAGVKAKRAVLCVFGDKAYGEPYTVIRLLGTVGCRSGGANGGAFTCSNERGRAACQRFLTAGMPVSCSLVH